MHEDDGSRKTRPAAQARLEAVKASTFWDHLSTASTLFSSVILGAVGLYATHSYNERQLAQATEESHDKNVLERAQVLDKFSHYMISPNSAERQLGYFLLRNLGQEDLALAIIKFKGDAAGISVAQSLVGNSNPETRANAQQIVNDLKVAETIAAKFEGFSPTPYHASSDRSGLWTIGFGHTQGVGPDTPMVTREQAMQLLADDLRQVSDLIDEIVKVPLTINQRAALIDFAWQMGSNALKSSALLKSLNERNYASVPDQLRLWVRANGAVMPGLAARREAEIALWNTSDS